MRWGRVAGTLGALAMVAGALAATPASAAVRYAAPDGDGPHATCPQSDPCDLHTAVEAAIVQDGDEVVVLPGTYTNVAGDQLNIEKAIEVRGKAGSPRPEVVSTVTVPAVPTVRSASNGAVVRRLRITQPGNAAGLLLLDGTVDRVIVDSIGGPACDTLGGTIHDSVCWSHGSGVNRGVTIGASGGGPFSLSLRNVTAVGTGANGTGVFATAGPSTDVTIDAKSVIALGGGTADVTASTATGGAATVMLDHSNFATASEEGSGTSSVTDPGSGENQVAEPVFVDAAGGDFRQYLGSPTINAGELDGSSGTFDLDSEPRMMGPEPDIGADEFDPTLPKTTIRRHPRRQTTRREARFRFTSDHPASTFECRLDGVPYEDCESPKRYSGLPRGKHVFKVRATDELGKVERPPARLAWKIVAD